jgi:GT2 family glycosyltransferase
LEAARGSLVAFIDADARLPTGWPDIAEQAFATHPDLVCLSGPYRYHDGSWPQRWLLNLISLFATLLGYRMFGYMLVGGNFIAKKKALEEIGGFDRTIDFYGEDTDLGRRLAQQGTALFSGRLFIYTSGRRFYAEGILRSNATYLINFLWIILFHRPYSTSHNDIRLYQE